MATVTLSVKNVPRDLARKLRDRATRHHRSLQGELLAILTDAATATTVADLSGLVRRLGLSTPRQSAAFVREDRDGRRR
ncbi:MAG TPA: Arc family DNA-binding protein [Vicinamibacterales bacterium]|nr:Arc family DNA-binding protein [Vicinamibacterales bacterium]